MPYQDNIQKFKQNKVIITKIGPVDQPGRSPGSHSGRPCVQIAPGPPIFNELDSFKRTGTKFTNNTASYLRA